MSLRKSMDVLPENPAGKVSLYGLMASVNTACKTSLSNGFFTLQETDFNKSAAIDIADYYLINRPLRDDRLSKEEKAELKANAREEGEKLFSRFLNEVLTFDDQQRLDYSWNRLYNAQSDIKHHKVPVGFECSRKFKSGVLQITDIQREGIAFMEAMDPESMPLM